MKVGTKAKKVHKNSDTFQLLFQENKREKLKLIDSTPTTYAHLPIIQTAANREAQLT